jgi:thioredoxin reductase
MSTRQPPVVLIVGAGPAGCSCAAWLALLGIRSVLIEQAAQPMDLLHRLDLAQNWVLGFPNGRTSDIAKAYLAHLRCFSNIQIRCRESHFQFGPLTATHKEIVLHDSTRVAGAAIVFATGLRAKRAWQYANSSDAPNIWDACALTQHRAQLQNQRILLLGGGDNAVENAVFLSQRNNQVVLWSRHALRAQAHLTDQLGAASALEQRIAQALPQRLARDAKTWVAESLAFGVEQFDHVAALFGYEPEDTAWQQMLDAASWRQQALPRVNVAAHRQLQHLGVFVSGDLSQRLHPCIQSALADGVTTAKQVAQWLKETHAS